MFFFQAVNLVCLDVLEPPPLPLEVSFVHSLILLSIVVAVVVEW